MVRHEDTKLTTAFLSTSVRGRFRVLRAFVRNSRRNDRRGPVQEPRSHCLDGLSHDIFHRRVTDLVVGQAEHLLSGRIGEGQLGARVDRAGGHLE